MANNIFSRVWDAIFDKRSSTYADHIYTQYFGGFNEAGEHVSADRGSKIAAVFTCVNVISQDVAKLPFNVHKDDKDGGAQITKSIPVYRLIHSSPNRHTTAFSFWYSIVWETLTKGNGIALIKRDENYIPSELIQLNYDNIKIIEEDGELFYDHHLKGPIPERDILHFKMFTKDGINGISVITHNAEVMGYKIKQEKYSAKVIGTKGSGFISSEGLTAEQGKKVADALKTQLEAGNIPFIGAQGQTKWNQQLITPNEGQYIETKLQTNTEIFGLFRMPPSFAQSYQHGASYTNSSHQDMVYVKHTLTPWIRMIEQECDRKLFSEANKVASKPYYTKFNVNGILRGDIQARAEFYNKMRTNGIMSANEIRKLENLPPIKHGDQVYIQGAMIPLGTPPAQVSDKSKREQSTSYEEHLN